MTGSVVPPTTGRALALRATSGGEGFGEEAAQDVGTGATFGPGDLVDLGDRFGVESDGVKLSGHVGQRITPLDNVIQRDTIQGMTTTQIHGINVTTTEYDRYEQIRTEMLAQGRSPADATQWAGHSIGIGTQLRAALAAENAYATAVAEGSRRNPVTLVVG